ncbi:MAG: GNAT family N-acetyltransferase [Bacteroidales bacterium]|nr:GNAT family N-acetyltransferase [Bacteroidales bacterium]
MNNKEKYKLLCETEGAKIPLFQQYWWMDTVCEGKEWDVVLVEKKYDNNKEWSVDQIRGALPYLVGHRLGMRYILQPQLTQFNGPYYRYKNPFSENQRLSYEKKIGEALVKQLEQLHLAYFEQNMSPSITNWLPFYWHGFHQTTRYTYRIDSLGDLDIVFAQMDYDKRQKKIRKAQKHLQTVDSITPKQFAQFHAEYWRSRNKRDLLSELFIERVVTKALDRKQGLLLGLADEMGVLQAARFVVFDERCAYSLLSALHPRKHDNGASALLFWELFQQLHGKTQAFDFEGSMDEGIEYSYRLYGAHQVPYLNISKCNNALFRLLLWVKQYRESK